ncbi:MAG: transporter substrate-binding domain-containing protein [bacterium]|nr:transporter substrate-binding domain-containing protein [bacterium]
MTLPVTVSKTLTCGAMAQWVKHGAQGGPMPRIVFVFLAALSGLLVAGCASSGGGLLGLGSRSPVIDRIQATGELRVGMAGDYPPLNGIDRAGENFGLEFDLAQFLARSLRVELKVVNRPFAELIDALEANEVDAVMSGMTMTPERNQRVAFAGPYFISGKGVVAHKSSALDTDSSIKDLDKTGVTLTALEGTTSLSLLRGEMRQAKVVASKDYEEAARQVLANEVDALVADYPVCVVAWAKNRDEGLRLWPDPLAFEPIGVAVPDNDPLFLNLVQNYIASLEGTGLLKQLRARWFEDASWIRRLP